MLQCAHPCTQQLPHALPVALVSQENEPDIYRAIRFGTILENVVFDEEVT